MYLTNAEKLIVLMLSDIYKHLNVSSSSEIDANFVKKAITTHNTWAIQFKYSELGFESEDGDDWAITGEVFPILFMWHELVSTYMHLSVENKTYIEKEVQQASKKVEFPGFDPNTEGDYFRIARFVVEELNYFPELRGRLIQRERATPSLLMHRALMSVVGPINEPFKPLNISPEKMITMLRLRELLDSEKPK
jgi:uncharacterized protein YfbU (UPF0304 family)